ncbi:DUF1616 domain-containing protein [Halorussus salinus]|uniref:DUF1616 domain-containing protein n=1 Tax=Halorussus salinus TaxID=1364935 RepID=UPI001091CC47|nr:DUF1616 domain-containing protein [Halorussus salinus]
MAPDPDRARLRQVLLPRSVAHLPADLAAVVGTVLLTVLAVLTPGLNQTPLRIVVGLPFVLFVPGYAFIAALFPEAATPTAAESASDNQAEEKEDDVGDASRLSLAAIQDRGSIDGIERVALSFGTSIAIVPLLGLILNFTPWGIRLVPIIITVSGFTLLATAIAARRRLQLPAEGRFRVPYNEWLATARTELIEPDTRTDLVLNVLLVASVLLAAASVTYAVAVPKQGESFTEFYVLTENETGELVADNYPTEFTVGESKPLHVGIGNHEHRQMDYTVVVELQQVQTTNNTTRVQAERELQRLQASVPANGTWRQQLNVTPPMEGQRMRLTFLLYRDSAPAQPTVENAYRELHLWVNVTAAQPTAQRRLSDVDSSSRTPSRLLTARVSG